ncbi:hypothetical protein I6F65_15305 [Pseudoalteromonas sp. SWXJZ94C]|uniref:hypothetical protein n=1 Tax=unclassified Pseudoalteromonas TaxID=194690 RepID=UPI00140D1051|nr:MULTISPECIES: hypothetical protein [unclassified Pseudoalteromonas]MBH0058326.1 hypothetical protein [Pseudoalteromonas sp. SWXJZ94C]
MVNKTLNYVKADATHIDFPVTNREEHFEWWYFDAHFENGDFLVVMFSLNDTRLKPRQPSVRLNIYPRGQSEISKIKKYTETDVSTSDIKCDVTFGKEEYCKDCGDHYELYTMIDGYGAKLTLNKGNHPYTSEGTDTPMPWTVAVPSGHIEGELYKNGKTTKVKGTGYHDHNWGEKSLAGRVKNWYWGKVHSSDISIDYSVIMDFEDNILQSGALVTDSKNLIISPSESMTDPENVKATAVINDIMTEDIMGYTFSKSLTLKGSKGDLSYIANIDLIALVMIEPGEFLPGEDAYRYIAKEELIVTRNGVTQTYLSEGLHEIVYPKK